MNFETIDSTSKRRNRLLGTQFVPSSPTSPCPFLPTSGKGSPRVFGANYVPSIPGCRIDNSVGELWQAEVTEGGPPINEGECVRVLGMRGLHC